MSANVSTVPRSVSASSISDLAMPVWAWLIVVGTVLSTVLSVFADHAMRGDIDNPVLGDLLAYQPPPWALQLGRLAFAMIFLGGVLAAMAPSGANFGRYYRVLIFAWVAYSLVLTARNLQFQDLLTSAVFSPLAPGCALASCLMFASADREIWRKLVRLVAYGALGVAFIALFEMVQMRSASRGEAFWRIDTYSKILEISAIVSFGWFAKQRKAWLGAIPLVALCAATIAMQTRLMVVEVITLLVFYKIFSRTKLSSKLLLPLCAGGLLMVAAIYFAWYSPNAVRSSLPASAAAFWDRSTEDTRSTQFVNFFAKVPPSTFLLGIGIPHPGEFNSLGSKGIDFGYVNILFLGGIPALFLFVIIHLLPALRSLGNKFDPVDAACLASVMTYAVRLFSSTIPGPSPGYFILMLFVGRTVMLLHEKRYRYRAAYSGPPAGRPVRNREAVAMVGKDVARVGNA